MRAFAFSFALFLTACGSELCSPEDLTSALASATPGSTVVVGACAIRGAFVVPGGVTLDGHAGSQLLSDGAAPILTLEAGATVRSLALQVDGGGIGIVSRSGSEVVLESLDLTVTAGVGVYLAGGPATLADVRMDGPIDDATALTAPITEDRIGTFGLVARDLTGVLQLTDVHISDFAVAGVAVNGGELVWTSTRPEPALEGIRGTGLALFGTTATLTDVEITGLRSGIGPVGLGIVLGPDTAMAELAATGLSIHDSQGYGVFSQAASVRLSDTSIVHVELAGLRLQGGSLAATRLRCEGNGGAGVLAIDTESVVLEDVTLLDQRTVGLTSGALSTDVGDGLHMVRDPASATAPALRLEVRGATLAGNQRAGILLDADMEAADVLLESVAVDATGTGLGVIAQNAMVTSGWDAGVSRTGAAVLNDAALSTPLSTVGIMMPPGLTAFPPDL